MTFGPVELVLSMRRPADVLVSEITQLHQEIVEGSQRGSDLCMGINSLGHGWSDVEET